MSMILIKIKNKVMEKKQFTIGIDVSKLTLDVHCSEVNCHIQILNNAEGFKQLLKWTKDKQINLAESLVVLEYTGGYEYRFLQFCESKNIIYVRLPGLAIKRSMGITRGKNDKVDAARIAQFGEEKHRAITPSKPLNISIMKLKELLGFRKKMVRENATLKGAIKERKHMYGLSNSDLIIKIMSKSIVTNEKDILIIEEAINEIIITNEAFMFNYNLITSIVGIGKVNAWMTIAYTENFTAFKDARCYGVYVGVIPFDHSSGTSIKGKKRISQIANKELKQELNQAAKSAIQWNGEMKEYANKKIETKHYRIVLNNVKFKLILRMFAVVKKGEKYVDNYKNVA
jgi:transposase